eukprot:GFKZ01008037.1.p1 GENE.GFKZ01008037.1~~GFKZ01008037.1.p1  ORF type:complete len:358 (-),score=70.65 GFKZ01008037.1:1409-2482(-)
MDPAAQISPARVSPRRATRSSTLSKTVYDLPRLPPPPTTSSKGGPALPPKLGIKKRKPRERAVVAAANHRARAGPVGTSQLGTPNRLPSPPKRPVKGIEQEARRKGLRHFAIRVSRKVEEKGVTTYNEVADELVAEELTLRKTELANGNGASADLRKRLQKGGGLVDEKNIRRRVYDSLNVLMAMGIIQKEKKLISWQGLAMARCARGSSQIATIKAAIAEKKRVLEEKAEMAAAAQDELARATALVERNRLDLSANDILNLSDPRLPVHHYHSERIGLPFLVFSAPKDAAIELEMDKARENICFTFSDSFMILDDTQVVRKLNLPAPVSLSSTNDIPDLEQLSNEILGIPAPESSS